MTTPKTPKDVIDLIAQQEIRMVDVRFCDLVGTWQHFTLPAHEVDQGALEGGFPFDGSSIRGWRAINNSDMNVVAECSTAQLDPFMEVPTLVIIGDIQDPITGQDYERDPRSLAKRAEA